MRLVEPAVYRVRVTLLVIRTREQGFLVIPINATPDSALARRCLTCLTKEYAARRGAVLPITKVAMK